MSGRIADKTSKKGKRGADEGQEEKIKETSRANKIDLKYYLFVEKIFFKYSFSVRRGVYFS